MKNRTMGAVFCAWLGVLGVLGSVWAPRLEAAEETSPGYLLLFEFGVPDMKAATVPLIRGPIS